ncbi:type II toxin-antitoxin system YafQ family toxin [Helicobacter sp. 23-1045]
MYIFKPASRFKRQYKKLSDDDKVRAKAVIDKLLNDEILDAKHKDHKLTGEYEGFRECHIKPDLLLIYKKEKRVLILTCLAIGSHSDLF